MNSTFSYTFSYRGTNESLAIALANVWKWKSAKLALINAIEEAINLGFWLLILYMLGIYSPITNYLLGDILFAGVGIFFGRRLAQSREHCSPGLTTLKRMCIAIILTFACAAFGVHVMHIPNTFFGRILYLILLVGFTHLIGAILARQELKALLSSLDFQLIAEKFRV